MKHFSSNLIILILSLLSTGAYSQSVTPLFNENFDKGNCSLNCYANTYNSWTVADVTTNGSYPNKWFVSCAEVGTPPNMCGQKSCAINNGCLHISIDSSTYRYYHNSYNFPCTTGDCGAVYFAGASDGNAVTDKRAESPKIDCSNAKCTVYMTFNYILNGDSTFDNMTIDYSPDNGTTWMEIATPAKTDTCGAGEGVWAKYKVALPESAVQNPTVKVGFHWVNNDDGIGSNPSVAIDSVELYTTALPFYNNIIIVSPSSTQCTDSVFVFSPSVYDTNYYYIWNGSLVQDTIHLSFAAAGSYTEQLTIGSATCGTSIFNRTIYVVNCYKPTASFEPGDTTICRGRCINFVNYSKAQGPAQYTWTFNGGTPDSYVGSSSPPPICFNSSGLIDTTYSIKLVVRDGSGNLDSVTKIITVDSARCIPNTINYISIAPLWKIYPNPTTGNFILETNFEKTIDATLSVENVMGQKLIQVNGKWNAGTNKEPIDISTLPAGVYFLKVENDEINLCRRVVKF